MKKIISFMLVLSIFTAGLAPMAFADLTVQEKNEKYYDDICSFAQEDASYEAGDGYFLWMGAGCLLGPIGMALGFFIPAAIPPSRIMGRPSAYVEQYTKCYTDAIRGQRLVITGLTCGIVWGTVLVFLYFARTMFQQ